MLTPLVLFECFKHSKDSNKILKLLNNIKDENLRKFHEVFFKTYVFLNDITYSIVLILII